MQQMQKFMEKLVKNAYKLIKSNKPEVHAKGRSDIVTSNDLFVENFLIEQFLEKYPNTKIISEETNSNNVLTDAPALIIDPIDGTTNYALGSSIWGIQMVYCDGGVPLVSVLYLPKLNLLLSATKGRGMSLNGKPYTATTPDFAKGTILFDGRCNDIAKRIMSSKLGKVQPSMRVYGSACYSLAMVALHRGLAFVTTNKNLWDNMPGILVCLESNCKVLYRDDCTIVTSQDWIYDTLSNLL